MTLSLTQNNGIPHPFNSIKGLKPDDQVLWPCSLLGNRLVYAIPVLPILHQGKLVWSPGIGYVEIPNTFQDNEPSRINLFLQMQAISEYPDLAKTGGYYFLAPQFNPEELTTIQEVAQRSLMDYRINLHSLIAFDYLRHLNQVIPPQGNQFFPLFKEKILNSLYELSVAYLGYNLDDLEMKPHLVQSTDNLRKTITLMGNLLDRINSPAAIAAKKVGKVWSRHLCFYSYSHLFLADSVHTHPQLEKESPILQTDSALSRDYCEHLNAIYRLELPRKTPDYPDLMNLYLNNRQNGELYNHFLGRFFIEVRKLAPYDTSKKLYDSAPFKSYVKDLGLRHLLDQILYQQDIPGFENDHSLQITNERIFQTLKFLVKDTTTFQNPVIAAFHTKMRLEAFAAFNSCYANEFNEHRILNFVSLIEKRFKTEEDRYQSIFYHMLDFMRNTRGNIDVAKIRHELLALHASLGENEPEFEQLLSNLLNLIQFQQDLYYLRDLKVPEDQRIVPLDILEELEKRQVLAQARPEIQIASPTEFDRESSASSEITRPYTPSPSPEPDRKEPEFQYIPTPRDPKLREIIRDLEQNGFIPNVFATGKGVHRRYVHKDFPVLNTTVPFHSGKSLKKGTLESIYNVIRQAQAQKLSQN